MAKALDETVKVNPLDVIAANFAPVQNRKKNRAITADDFEKTEKGYRDLWTLVRRNFDSVTHWCTADHQDEVARLRLLVR